MPLFNNKPVERDEETIAAAKFMQNERRRQAVGNVIKFVAKNTIPKGIKNPDDMVRNRHLYFPLKRGQKAPKAKLF